MKFLNTIVFGVLGFFFLVGCSESLPKDFPTVHPTTVTVTDGGTPLSEVKVSFLAVGGGNFAVSGATNASGITKPITAQGPFAKEGIPAGEYVVTVQDIMKVDLGVPPEEIAKMTRAEQGELEKKRQELLKSYKKKVPDTLCKSGKVETRSPIRHTITEGKNELSIDVAEYKK